MTNKPIGKITGPLMICEECGLQFASRQFGSDSGSRGMTYVGVSESCPNCGGRAYAPTQRIDEGRITFLNSARALLSSPAVARRDIERLRDLLEKAKAEGTSPDQVVAAAESQNAQFGRLLRLASPSNPVMFWAMMTLLLPLLLVALRRGPERPLDTTQLAVERNVPGQVVEKAFPLPAVQPTLAELVTPDVSTIEPISIPQGHVPYVKRAAKILLDPRISLDQLNELHRLVEEAITEGDAQKVHDAVSCQVPLAPSRTKYLTPTNSGEFWGMIGALGTLATIVIALRRSGASPSPPVVINQYFRGEPDSIEVAPAAVTGPQTSTSRRSRSTGGVGKHSAQKRRPKKRHH